MGYSPRKKMGTRFKNDLTEKVHLGDYFSDNQV